MLPGASRRKLPRDVGRSLQPAFEQLNLPWLAPRQYLRAQSPARTPLQRRPTTTVASRRPSAPVRAQTTPVTSRHKEQHERSYAHAASPDISGYQLDDVYVPLVTESAGMGSSWEQRRTEPAVYASDPTRLLDTTEIRLPFRAKSGALPNSVSINPIELHQNLEACLIVGLHERAASTMRRLTKIYDQSNPLLVRAHNYFIGHMIGLYNKEGDEKMVDYIDRWLHVDMIRQGVQPDAATYAMMIQLMLSIGDSSRAARGLRRYIKAVEEFGLTDPVKVELQSVLNAADFLRIKEMAPGFLECEVDTAVTTTEHEMDKSLEAETTDDTQFDWREGIPQVRAVEQKGEGLHTLRQSLSSLTSPQSRKSPAMSTEAFNTMRQRKLENDVYDAALRRWKADYEAAQRRGAISGSLKTMSINALSWNWHLKLSELIQKELDEFPDGDGHSSSDVMTSAAHVAYAPYLRFTSIPKLSVIVIATVLNAFASTGAFKQKFTPISKTVVAIGNAVQHESQKEWAKMKRRNRFVLNAEKKGENDPSLAFKKESSSGSASIRNFRQEQEPVSTTMNAPEWTIATRTRVGAALLALMLKAAVLPPVKSSIAGEGLLGTRMALERRMEFTNGKKLGTLVCDKYLLRELTRQPNTLSFAKRLPMLIQPKPWVDYKKGAYLNDGVPMARISARAFQSESYLKLAVKNGDMKHVLEGLDVLGRTPWKVNRNVFDVFLKVWNSGEALANIPPLDPVLDYPDPPSPNATAAEKRDYAIAKKALDDKLAGFHSERCFMNFQLETASAFLHDEFYMPHNLDFRGRAYPIPPYLNHMGADHARGLLLFARGKELGPKGLEWLKIQLANVYGFDKASLAERRAFADEHLEQIYDSANHPLDGQRWWLKAEDPWQCLAACCELRDALDSPDPAKFISHLPVHQDGTCNGLQHYAALGGDEAGAKQVNLEPGDRPSDIYTAVSDLVAQSIHEDAEKGFQIAKMMDGKVTRKVVKQTVMTNVYGVTFQGARQQVLNRLNELYPELEQDRFVKYQLCTYIVKKIFEALGKIFNGASAIQRWLGDCATQICKSLTPEQMEVLEDLQSQRLKAKAEGRKLPRPSKSQLDHLAEHTRFKSTIIWTSPLGLPVVQPYRNETALRVETSLQMINILQPSLGDEVSARQQLQAFPPNFIHSLDATHMLLSALVCDKLGMSFAAVHDSFWTHAADVDRMSSELRNAFIRMHSEDIVGRLAAEFRARYKGNLCQVSILARSPLGEKIMAKRSKERAGKTKTADHNRLMELLEERERQRLLASDDPELRRQGEEMVTPASLYLQSDPQDRMLSASHEAEALSADAVRDVEDDLSDTDKDDLLETNEDTTASLDSSDIMVQETDTSANQPESSGKQRRSRKKRDKEEKFAMENVPGISQMALDMARELREMGGDRKRRIGTHYMLKIWIPVNIPEIPRKGDWSVSRLKKSVYFFS